MTIIVRVGSDHIKVVDMENKIHKAKKDKDDAKQSKNKAMDKAQKLKDHMRTDVQITDEEYLSIMSEVHQYEVTEGCSGKDERELNYFFGRTWINFRSFESSRRSRG